jgi:hypothetical protein
MSYWTRIRGAMLLAGGLAGVVVMAIHPDDPRDPLNGPLHFFYFFSTMLVILGLQGAPDRLRGRTGAATGAGFILLSLFFAVNELSHSVLDATILPALLNNPTTTDLISQGSWLEQALFAGAFGTMMMMGMVLLMISVVLVGIGTLIEGSYPRWPAVLLLAAASTAILPLGHGPVGPALLYVSVAGFGFAILTAAGREPLPVWLPLPRRTARQAPLG